MATYWAQKAGNINADDVWFDAPAGGAGVSGATALAGTHVLCANNYKVEVTVGFTAARISTTGETTGTAGGQFRITGTAAMTITADVLAGTSICLYSLHSGTGANGVTVQGAVTGGSANAYGAQNGSTGTMTITGAVTGGSATNAHGALNGSTGTMTITGAVTGGSAPNANGALNNSAGTMTITGAVTGGSTSRAYGVFNNTTGVITVSNSLIDTEECGAYTGSIRWQPVAGAHYHKVFYAAGTPKYYSLPPAQTDVRDGVFGGFSDPGVAYNGTVVLPSAGDVRDGVDFDYPGKETGTLRLPAEADVRDGVLYGSSGEFEGDLVAGGGGVPLIGPGGLVG